MSDWQRVQTIFLASVDLPEPERTPFLAQSCGDDAALRHEVETLLSQDLDSGALFDRAVRQEASRLLSADILVGERLGTYRIVREIGRGGMGSVYLALRDDEEYTRQVALKVVRRGMDTADVLNRFRYERQILANLSHPYIARLFDGGSTEGGVPFFVMEYVEGVPVSAFCRERALDIDGRCRLFVRILEAVAYAHRSLVVHRDLKPANILITADGTPKLLDFGVAKLLTGQGDAGNTRTTSIRPYTAAYASPEQVRGLPITTATDIYSLGAILYELFTGRKAQVPSADTPVEIDRAVCQIEVSRPSLHARGLPHDLDNIVLMALRKEPERRYQSALQFAEDISRYLEGRPVLACGHSLRYKVGKFVVRNRLQVAAASTVSLAILGGLIVSMAQTRRAEAAQGVAESQRRIALQQTHLAETARLQELHQETVAGQQRSLADQQKQRADQQRDEAQRQKAIADQRVHDMFGFAEKALFDVHDEIAKIPGSMAARREIVTDTLGFLQTLQGEVGLDDEMREALTAAYYKIAMIQGDAQGASEQDFSGAANSLHTGETLLMPAYNHHPNDAGMILRLIEIRASLADLMYRDGQRKEAVQANIDLLPIAHKLLTVPECSVQCRAQEATLENNITNELVGFDPPGALVHANRGIAETRKLIALYPAETLLKQGLGSLTAGGAGAYRNMGDLEQAATYYRQSIDAREQLLRDTPNDASLRRSLLIVYGNYVVLLGIPWSPNLDRPEEARAYATKAVAIARELVAADAGNGTARHDLGMILGRLGMIDPAPDGIAASLAHLEEAQSLIEPIAKANPTSAETANQLAITLEYKGVRQEQLGQCADALKTYQAGLTVLQPFRDAKNITVSGQTIAIEDRLALFHASKGEGDQALKFANDALEAGRNLAAAPPATDARTAVLASAWSELAMTQMRLHQPDQARQSAASAMQLWTSLKRQNILTAHRQELAELHAILQ